MNLHNLMEEKVVKHVNELYDQMKEQNISWLSCDCEHCRLDTASYVLNRIPPKYVVSGRGVSHNVSADDTQLKADIDVYVGENVKEDEKSIAFSLTFKDQTRTLKQDPLK